MGSLFSREAAGDDAAYLHPGASRPSFLSSLCCRGVPDGVDDQVKNVRRGKKASTQSDPPSITLKLQHGDRITTLVIPTQDFYPLQQLHAMRSEAEASLGIDSSTHRITGMFAEATYAPFVPFIMLPKLQPSRTPYAVTVHPVDDCPTSLGVACRPEPVRPGHAPQVTFAQLQRDVAARKAASSQQSNNNPVHLELLHRVSDSDPQPFLQQHEDTVSQFISALQQVGYVRLEIQQPAALAAVVEGFNAMHNLMQVPAATQAKLITRVGTQFVGFSEPGPRHFYQMRRFHTALPFSHRRQHLPSSEPTSLSGIAINSPAMPSATDTTSPPAPVPPTNDTPTQASTINQMISDPSLQPSALHAAADPPSNTAASPQSLAVAASPKVTACTAEIDDATSTAAEAALITVYDLLRDAAMTCVEAIALGLQMDPASLTSLLDDPQDLPWITSSPEPVCSTSPISDPGPSFESDQQTGEVLSLPTKPAIGSDVFRAYHYWRPAGTLPPMLRNPATGLHCDMGLLTVSPLANLPGLAVLHPSGSYFMDVESAHGDLCPVKASTLSPLELNTTDRLAEQGEMCPASEQQSGQSAPPPPLILIVFGGEALGLVTGGRLRAPVHYVDERFMGTARVSLPFFLRPRPGVNINLFDIPTNLGPPDETADIQSAVMPEDCIAPSPAFPEKDVFRESGGQVLEVKLQNGEGKVGRAVGHAMTYSEFIEKVVWRERPWARVAVGSKQDY